MFHKWGFLLTEIWGLLALAALLGLLVGWLIWGRRSSVVVDTGEAGQLRGDLAACEAKRSALLGQVAALEHDLSQSEAKAKASDARAAAAAQVSAAVSQAAAPAPMAAMAAPVMAAPVAAATTTAAPAASGAARKPEALSGPRGGKADDLKLVKGIGPKLEILCNKLGFYHFDQIANWTAAEIAWVDENLEGFKGRVTRDEWVAQARDLAAGKPPRAGGEN